MSKISPCLWFASEAEEAARFYVSLLPDSRIDRVTHSTLDTPGGKTDAVLIVEFTLAGSSYQALNTGTPPVSSNAISLSVSTADQAETDRLWDALIADGGAPIQCGWLKDRWGFSWQIVPEPFLRLIGDPDPARARRAMEAMMTMTKLDVAALEAAANGEGA